MHLFACFNITGICLPRACRLNKSGPLIVINKDKKEEIYDDMNLVNKYEFSSTLFEI